MEHSFDTGAISKPDINNFKVKEVEKFLPQDIAFPEFYKADMTKIPVLYQGKQPACVGHAAAAAKMLADFIDTGTVRAYSPRYLYAMCKALDGIPEVDGTFPIQVLKILQKYGVSTESYFKNDIALSREAYNSIAGLTPEAKENAEDGLISAYFEVTDKSFANLKKEIFRNKFLLACINHGGEFYTTPSGQVTWDKNKLFPMKMISPIISGHEVLLTGYDPEFIYYRNSFGEKWGDEGDGWFGADYLPRLKEVHGFVDLPQSVIDELKKKREQLMYQIIARLTEIINKLKGK